MNSTNSNVSPLELDTKLLTLWEKLVESDETMQQFTAREYFSDGLNILVEITQLIEKYNFNPETDFVLPKNRFEVYSQIADEIALDCAPCIDNCCTRQRKGSLKRGAEVIAVGMMVDGELGSFLGVPTIPLDEKGCKYLTAEDQTCGVHNERAIMCGLFPVYLNPVFWKQRRTHMDSLGASVMPEMPRRYTGKMKILVHKCTRKNHPGGVSTQLTETNLDNAIRLASRVIISSPEYISATKHFAVNFEGFFPRRNYVVKHSNPI